jgi:ribosomal protein S18 acetylase RimI-like enzyme
MDGRSIGCVRANVKEGTCHIGKLIIHPDFQKRGIGTRLMSEMEKVFKAVRGLSSSRAIKVREISIFIKSVAIGYSKRLKLQIGRMLFSLRKGGGINEIAVG